MIRVESTVVGPHRLPEPWTRSCCRDAFGSQDNAWLLSSPAPSDLRAVGRRVRSRVEGSPRRATLLAERGRRSLVRLVVVRLNVAAIKGGWGRNTPPSDRDAVDRDIRLIPRCPGFLTVVDENERN